MSRTGKRLFISAVAVMFTASIAIAEGNRDGRARKANIFEKVFGTSSSKRQAATTKKRRALFGRNWWSDDGDVRIISGQESNRKLRQVIVADDDPEGDPGFGMGNLTYVPEKQVPLGGLKFTEQRPLDAESGAIHDALTVSDPEVRVLPAIREALADHYRQQSFRPLWLADGKLSPRGSAILRQLAAADAEGLEAANYLPQSLATFDTLPPEGDIAAMARLDVELTAKALTYARHASGGQFDPRRLSLYNDMTPAGAAPGQSIKVLGWSPFPAEYLASLHPRHPAYAALKAELAELRKAETVTTVDPIADGKIVKTGQLDERIETVRQRLFDLGYLAALEAAGDPQILDADLAVQLRLFQKASGIKVTGALGPQTVAALNNQGIGRNIARLLNNIERLRWLPKSLGTRHVFVNQPAFEVRVMEQDKEIWQSRVIIGKTHTQTNAFHDEIETVVFNPSWGVPPSIIANEYLPKLRRDPGYLDRIGFKVVNAEGKVVPSRSVSWASYGGKVPYGIQQPPGAKNALGELKFLFPNSHNIYMHDTPSRELFDNDVRNFSHGCVRVQNPREFAAVLLGWDQARIDENTESKKSQNVKLAAKVPIHITYFTAWPDSTGKIQYFNDIYGRDQTMENARTAITLAQR
jgi:L,D-transpeptidase YcbB